MRLLKELMDMEGRVVLVTGGAGHVGRTAAETFAELGATVAILDLEDSGASEVAESVAARFGVRCLVLPCDLEKEAGVLEAVRIVDANLGRLDVLVNSAALVGTSELSGWVGRFEDQSIETWRRALEVNLTAPFVLVQAAVPLLRAAPSGGVVINVSSVYGIVGPDMRLYEGTPLGNPAAYSTSKGGLNQLTRWLATVLAPEVRVNAIAPGGLKRGQPEEFQTRYASRAPLRRMGMEEDLKGAFAYLGSDLSRYVTGEILYVDGGWRAW